MKAYSNVGGLRRFDRIAAAKAVSNPLRAAILTRLGASRRSRSPVALSKELDAPLGNVSYHFEVLLELGCIELAATQPRRGAIEHFYRALVEITVEVTEL